MPKAYQVGFNDHVSVRMASCSRCRAVARPTARFCVRCGHPIREGLSWYSAIPLALLGGLFNGFGFLLAAGLDAPPDWVRPIVELSIVVGVITAVGIVWFAWLCYALRRRAGDAR